MFCFFFNDTAPPGIYTYVHTLSLHDALPICLVGAGQDDHRCAPLALVGDHQLAHDPRHLVGPAEDQRVARLDHGAPPPPELLDLLVDGVRDEADRSEEHTSAVQSLMRISYAVFCLKKNK